jgi:formamidopyrimidine-DNA glycosylase
VPELPEVETTVNDLKPFITGKTIWKVEVFTPNSVAEPSAVDFQQSLKGLKIKGISRRGKFILIELDKSEYLIVHLRMTGSLLFKPEDPAPEKFVRILLHFKDNTSLHFRDVRRFGRMWLVKDVDSVVGKLGLEPLSPEFTVAALKAILAKRSTPIKALLLDQTLIAGIGNMYADEALYLAKIHPLIPADALSANQIKLLYAAIRSVLEQGIRNKGASTDTFYRPEGEKGAAHLAFKVAHKGGETCPICGGPIERIVVHQRGTFFCPRCQKLPAKFKK